MPPRPLALAALVVASACASPGVRLARAFPTMGTLCEVEVEAADTATAERALEAARAAIERVDRTMSVYRESSDIVRANHAAGGAAVRVDPWTADCVAKGRAFAAASGGAFSTNTLAYGIAVGLKPPLGMPAASPAPLGGDERIGVSFDPPTLRLPAGYGLDLGGIAKGYALDRAAGALRAAGVRRFVIDLGRGVLAGDAPRAAWPRGARGWPVRLEGETAPREIARLSIAVSEQFADADTPHVVDPRSGRPAAGGRRAVVAADEGWIADAASTALLVDPSLEEALSRRFPSIRESRTFDRASPR